MKVSGALFVVLGAPLAGEFTVGYMRQYPIPALVLFGVTVWAALSLMRRAGK